MDNVQQDFVSDLLKVIQPKEMVHEDNTYHRYYNFQKPILIYSKKGVYFNGVLYEGENAEQLAIKAKNKYYNK